MRTRTETVEKVAVMLCLSTGADWLRVPDARQAKRQAEFRSLARRIVSEIEKSLKDFSWKPEAE